MSLTSAFEMGLIRPVIQEIADILAGGISVSVIPENREPFVNLPGLRGYWPMSAVDFLGNAKDHSAASSDLARIGAPQFSYDGNAFIQISPTGNYLAGSTSAQTITGLETWINPTKRGLTMGCWVMLDATPPSSGGIITKYGAATTRSYATYFKATTREVEFAVSNTGVAVTTVKSPAVVLSAWMFIAARFIPSTEITVFVNDIKTTNTSGIPVSLYVSATPFEVGRVSAISTQVPTAKFRDVFLCQTALTDVQIENLRLSSLPNT